MQTIQDNNAYKAVNVVNRHYWKREETEESWTQPTLSANGTIGGSSFACAASSKNASSVDAWYAFNKVTDNGWMSAQNQQNNSWLEWYNPKPLKITKIVFTTGVYIYGDSAVAKNYKVQASDDNAIWVDIKTGATSSGVITTITENININQAYKYWRIFVVDVWNNNNGVAIDNVTITAVTVEETIVPATADDYDFYTEEEFYQCWGSAPETIFESSTGGSYTVNLEATGNYEITCVGGGGAAAMRGVYDDKGYGWGGGSGGAYKGIFNLAAGSYNVIVGAANNNTKAQSGNTQTLNPSDTTTHDSSISGVLTCGGGGAAHYNTSYVGAAGAAPVFYIMPESTTLNSAGRAGSYNSGGKGSAAAATCAGGASVYLDYGKGQGCKTSEYAAKRSWINGTNGYVRIRRIPQ